MIVLRKSFYIRWSAGRSPRVHEVNPGRDPSVRTVVTKDDFNKVASSYVLESSNIWHARLGQVNYKSIKKLMNMGLLPNFDCPSEKCQVCVNLNFLSPLSIM